MVLLQGPTGWQFLTSEDALYRISSLNRKPPPPLDRRRSMGTGLP